MSLSKEDIQFARCLYKEAADKNKQIKILTQLLCCNRETIVSIVSDIAVLEKPKSKRPDIVFALKNGMSKYEAAKKFEVSRSFVRSIARKEGL